MAVEPGHIEKLIRDALPDADITISDPRGDGAHYAVAVTSPVFSGLERLEQHRIIHRALGDYVDYETPGISIKTTAPTGK